MLEIQPFSSSSEAQMTEERSSDGETFTKRRSAAQCDSPSDRGDSTPNHNSHPFVIRSESFLSVSTLDAAQDKDQQPSLRESGERPSDPQDIIIQSVQTFK